MRLDGCSGPLSTVYIRFDRGAMRPKTYSSNPETATHIINADTPSLGLFNSSQNPMSSEGYTNSGADPRNLPAVPRQSSRNDLRRSSPSMESQETRKTPQCPQHNGLRRPTPLIAMPPIAPTVIGGISSKKSTQRT